MSFWIFKTSRASPYPDVPSQAYVFDNTHSVRVQSRDEFLYLRTGAGRYELTGAGTVRCVTSRIPKRDERRTPKVKRMQTARLKDVVDFVPPLDISRRSTRGRRNRYRLGLPADVNTIGWSRSMPRISRSLFITLLDAAIRNSKEDKSSVAELGEQREEPTAWSIENNEALVKVRPRLDRFRRQVLHRHSHTCLVCGTQQQSALEVAHIRPYSADKANRANPANGICLCKFCHACFDAGEITIWPDGEVKVFLCDALLDSVAKIHFTAVAPSARRRWLRGVDSQFLTERCRALQGLATGTRR